MGRGMVRGIVAENVTPATNLPCHSLQAVLHNVVRQARHIAAAACAARTHLMLAVLKAGAVAFRTLAHCRSSVVVKKERRPRWLVACSGGWWRLLDVGGRRCGLELLRYCLSCEC